MKITIDYLKSIWKNKLTILVGLKNLLFTSGKVGIMAKKRIAICNVCPSNSKNAKKYKSYKSNIPFNHCIECGCSLLIKPFAESAECPKKLWFSRKL